MKLDHTKRPALLQEPISSYDFLTAHLVSIIREEPARMRMGLIALIGEDEDFTDQIAGEECIPNSGNIPLPSCGAVGCIAGWTTMLTKGYY